MKYNQKFNPGDNFIPSASRENALNQLLSSHYIERNSGNRRLYNSQKMTVFNAGDTVISEFSPVVPLTGISEYSTSPFLKVEGFTGPHPPYYIDYEVYNDICGFSVNRILPGECGQIHTSGIFPVYIHETLFPSLSNEKCYLKPRVIGVEPTDDDRFYRCLATDGERLAYILFRPLNFKRREHTYSGMFEMTYTTGYDYIHVNGGYVEANGVFKEVHYANIPLESSHAYVYVECQFDENTKTFGVPYIGWSDTSYRLYKKNRAVIGEYYFNNLKSKVEALIQYPVPYITFIETSECSD